MNHGKFTEAAVLMPLVFENDSSLSFVFTKRSEMVRHHKGQICFPGGAREVTDENLWQTALRETYEETGWERERIRLIGEINTLSTPTGYVVTPFIGVVNPWRDLRANPHEIDEVFSVPLSHLRDPKNVRYETREYWGKKFQIPFFTFEKHIIWGATGRMLHAFLQNFDEQEILKNLDFAKVTALAV